MTVTAAPHRRALLNALLALPVLGTAAGAASALQAGKAAGSAAASLPDTVFSNRRSAAILGHAYLLQRPDEADADRLEKLLLSPANLAAFSEAGFGEGDVTAMPSVALKKVFQALRRRDFEEGDVVQIDGCMLSVTELRLCALSALT